MEFYAEVYKQQLSPFVAVVLKKSHGLDLFQEFLDKANLSNKIWDDVIIRNRLLKAKYSFRYFNDEREVFETISLHQTVSKEKGVHSLLSPFNVDSDLFPNGILSFKWFQKYNLDFPAAVICSYGLCDDSTNDEALGLQLTNQKEQFAAFGIKYIAVVVSESDDAATIARIAQLRQVSGLPKSSRLFHISRNSESSNRSVFARDSDTLASSIISILKPICTDFYSAIEHRVEQRHQKFYKVPHSDQIDTHIQLTPDFLDVRNCIKKAMLTQLIHPHSIEGALPLLEQAYVGLFALINKNLGIFSNIDASSHDKRIFNDWRTLLDILAIHLVRGYFSIEEPIAALQKHDSHIRNLADLLPNDLQNRVWSAIQYQWLADLMSLIPSSLLNDLHVMNPRKSSPNRSLFFGGIAFHNSIRLNIITSTPLIYIKAAGLISDLESVDTPFFATREMAIAYKIKLLRAAKGLFQEQFELMGRIENVVDWQIADEQMRIEDYEGAKETLDHICANMESIPLYLRLHLHKRKIELFDKMGDSDNLVKSLIECALEDPASSNLHYFLSLLGLRSVKPVLSDILAIEPLIFFKDPSNDHVLSPVVHQLVVTAKSWIAFQIVGGLKLDLYQVKSIQVAFSKDSLRKFTGDGTQMSQFQRIESQFNSSWLKNGQLVLEFQECPKISGWHGITRIDIEISIRLSLNNVIFDCDLCETHEFTEPKFQDSMLVYYEDAMGNIHSTAKLLNGRQSNQIFIKPYKPDLNFKCVSPYSTAIIDEKLNLPVEFSRTVFPDASLLFTEVYIEVKSRVTQNGEDSLHYMVQHNWNQLKDDVPLDMLSFLYSNEAQTSLILHASVKRTNTEIVEQDSNLVAVLDFLIVVTERSGTVSSYELAQVKLNVLTLPLDTMFSISPRHSETRNLMPNPFILSMAHNDYAMPQPNRTWLIKMSRLDPHKLMEKEEIEIVKVIIDMKSHSSEIEISSQDSVKLHNEYYQQIFFVQSKAHVNQSGIPVTIQGSIYWKRPNNEAVYTFNTAEVDFLIQVQDPRVLVNVTHLENNTMKLEYRIENPTPRIMTFAAYLSIDNATSQGVEWNLLDAPNLMVLNKVPFPVLPFSVYRMVFFGAYNASKTPSCITLPRLQVQDMNYKIELEPQPIQECVSKKENYLVYNVS